MSQEVEELLSQEGMDDVDTLMQWARERADALVSSAQADAELGPLLERGGEAGDAPVVAATPAVQQPPPAARKEPSNAAPLPPIPVATRAVPTDELELDEIEELDMEELELLEDVDDVEGEDDEGPSEDEDTNVSPPPSPPEGPSDSISSGDEAQSENAEGPTEDSTASFGPPDGNEVVPEWKAALMSTQTETDEEAAAQVKEASSAAPLPEAPTEAGQPISERLEAEEDEISQHSVDLSDLE